MTNSHRTKEEIPIFFNYFISDKIVKYYFFQFSIGKMKKIIIQHIIPGNIDKRRFLKIILSDTTSKIMKKIFAYFQE